MKATVIKKAPVVQEKQEIKDAPVKRKVVIKKKPVVKIKMKEEVIAEKPVEKSEEPAVATPAPTSAPAPKPPVQRETPVAEKKTEEKKNYGTIIGQNRFAQHKGEQRSPSTRISSPLHNGPVIIKSSNLPPVPGQKVDTPTSDPARPRVAGIVGGRPVNQKGGYQNKKDGHQGQGGYRKKEGFNSSLKPGQTYTPGREGQNKTFNRDGNKGPAFRGQGFNRPGFAGKGPAQAPAMDLNQKGPGKRTGVQNRKKDYDKNTREQAEIDFQLQKKKKEEDKLAAVPSKIDIMENITVSDLAKKMNLKASDIISKLFMMGQMVTINQMIDYETAAIIASEYNCEVHLVSLYDETIIESEEDKEEDMEPRAPIVTIMGHVDHGKTKLLDAIRSSDVASGEFGGITQHIGAYKVSVPGKGNIVFLDTPGHAAFSMMRARGAQVTDIVVLVVAANDGVMPQTREAIDHAKAANVPIIVAINKCDLPEANPERVMQQLSDLGLMPEEWGGQTLYCKISALKKEGIDELLDTILLEAEMLELRANAHCRAVGKILESRIDQGRGTVATVIIEKGTLHQGDYYVAGIYPGRVRAMFDDKGKKIQSAGPSDPVEIIGLSNIPSAGDPFQVTEDVATQAAATRSRLRISMTRSRKARSRTSTSSSRVMCRVPSKLFRARLRSSAQARSASTSSVHPPVPSSKATSRWLPLQMRLSSASMSVRLRVPRLLPSRRKLKSRSTTSFMTLLMTSRQQWKACSHLKSGKLTSALPKSGKSSVCRRSVLSQDATSSKERSQGMLMSRLSGTASRSTRRTSR